jgi:chromosome segregation ATPase
VTTRKLKSIISLAGEVRDCRPPSAELERSLVNLIIEVASVINRLKWIGAHRYALDLDLRERQAMMLNQASSAAELLGVALKNLSAHTDSVYMSDGLTAQLFNLSQGLLAEQEILAEFESTLSLRLNDPELALVQLRSQREILNREPRHSRGELMELVETVDKLRREVNEAERAVSQRSAERDHFKDRLIKAQTVQVSLQSEIKQITENLETLRTERQLLEERSVALNQDYNSLDSRLRELRSDLQKLDEDPRACLRKSITKALQCLPKDATER